METCGECSLGGLASPHESHADDEEVLQVATRCYMLLSGLLRAQTVVATEFNIQLVSFLASRASGSFLTKHSGYELTHCAY